MNVHKQFHGNVHPTRIGFELRRLVKVERKSFKILTGYGSVTGKSLSRDVAIKELTIMKDNGLIKAFIPGSIKNEILGIDSVYYEDKLKYDRLLSKDLDYGNSGIIFVII